MRFIKMVQTRSKCTHLPRYRLEENNNKEVIKFPSQNKKIKASKQLNRRKQLHKSHNRHQKLRKNLRGSQTSRRAQKTIPASLSQEEKNLKVGNNADKSFPQLKSIPGMCRRKPYKYNSSKDRKVRKFMHLGSAMS